MDRGMRIILAAVGVLAVSAAAIEGHAPASAKVAFATEQRAIPFQLFRDQRIFLDGVINGTATAMMLDSGAGMTVVDSAFARRLGLKTGQKIDVRGASGTVPGEIAGGVTLAVGGMTLTDLDVLIIDLSHVAQSIGRPLPVVLGSDAFKAGAVTIDFPKRTLRFSDAARLTPPPGASRLDLGERDRLPSVKVSVAGLAPIEADFDLGNGGTLLLAKSYWQAQPTIASLRSAQGRVGGVGGMKPARRVTLPAVEFAGIKFADVPATLNEDAGSLPQEGANLGLAMLRSFVVTIDTPGKAMYLQPAARRRPLDRDRAGVHSELVGDRLKVLFVSPEGPAAAAGLKAGDEIVAIAGRKVGPDYYSQPEWTRGLAGTTVAVSRADGSALQVKLADFY